MYFTNRVENSVDPDQLLICMDSVFNNRMVEHEKGEIHALCDPDSYLSARGHRTSGCVFYMYVGVQLLKSGALFAILSIL